MIIEDVKECNESIIDELEPGEVEEMERQLLDEIHLDQQIHNKRKRYFTTL